MATQNGNGNGISRTADRIIAILALLVLIAFLGVIVAKVPHADLIIVVLIGIALAAFDFWEQLFRRR
ncbi:hypothetical protein [Mesorhizobium xinjiangense]|uniref:hypothetical protein n=1 Tax=Mesorhizobium xinjiangense TaxID=2678685 RepID=UPI0012EE187C|nr:hypothetical protein [Mesorhizobium xinjiangense]